MRRRIAIPALCILALLALVGGLAVSVGARSPGRGRASASDHRTTTGAAGATGTSGAAGIAGSPPASAPPAGSQPPAAVALKSGWRYLADSRNVGLRRGWGQGAPGLQWRPVAMPNDFNPSYSPGARTGMVGWYELRFTGPLTPAQRSWAVHFDEVRRNAEAWLNGRKLGSNWNPFAPFSLPASGLRPGAPNLLVVRVDDFFGPDSFPEDWWNWGGIEGPVTLEPVGRLTLTDLGVMPELGCHYTCGDLLVQGTLHNGSLGTLRPTVVLNVTSPSGSQRSWRHSEPALPAGASEGVALRVPVHGPLALWSPQSPALYGVQVQTVAGQRVEQDDELKAGMRSVSVRHGILYLNGHRLWLHGAAIHEDMPGRGPALTGGDINTIVSELRSVGANITRAHYLLAPRLLDALDAAGIMVWQQPPVDHADPVLRTRAGRAQALEMLRATILGGRSHPSVIVDSVGNELSPTPDTTPGTRSYLEQAIPVARSLDPAALVGLDTYPYTHYPAQRIYSKLDVIGISDYFGWYKGAPRHSIADFSGLAPFLRESHARYPNQALAVSEFGAEGVYQGSPAVKGAYAFQSAYLTRTFGVLDRLPFMNGAIWWTLREFVIGPGWTGGAVLPRGYAFDGLHHKGLIAYDGTEKPAFALAAQLFARLPAFAR